MACTTCRVQAGLAVRRIAIYAVIGIVAVALWKKVS
jgi:hypothetical protein